MVLNLSLANRTISELLTDIERGGIALLDMQKVCLGQHQGSRLS
jgi:hypothetical protein